MPYFNIRTTTSVYRDYAIECANEEEAKKLANALAYAESPKSVLETCKGPAHTIRNDVDVNACVSPMSKNTWSGLAPADTVAHPE
jgi:hypothetical protein